MDEKFLIVSLGSIGRRHLNNLRRLRPAAQIGVLRLNTTISPDVLPDGVDVQFDTIESALAFRPSAAIVAGPASTHLKVARKLADASLPMLLEKPIADSCNGLRPLIEGCKAQKVPIMTGYNLRFLPSLQEAKRLLETGCIGQVLGVRAEVGQYLPDWRPASRYQETVSSQRRLGGGALLELSHEIDYLYWFFGLPQYVTAIGGHYSALEIDVEDMVNVCLEYENRRFLVNIHMDFLQRSPTRGCKFIGEKGTLVWNGISDEIDLFCAEKGVWERLATSALSDRNQMYMDELAHFLDCVNKKTTPAIDGVQGYDVLAIVDAARASLEHRSAVKVEGYART
jgi:predicted dehydrogenase